MVYWLKYSDDINLRDLKRCSERHLLAVSFLILSLLSVSGITWCALHIDVTVCTVEIQNTPPVVDQAWTKSRFDKTKWPVDLWRNSVFRLVVSTPLKNISQVAWLFPIYMEAEEVFSKYQPVFNLIQTGIAKQHIFPVLLPSTGVPSCKSLMITY